MVRTLSLIACLAIFISGCARQPLRSVDDFERYQDRLARLDHWQLQGRMNLRIPGDSETVRVNWNQEAERYAIRLSGALGMGATWIRGDDREVRLEQGGQPPLVADSPEDLAYTQLGRELPISDLRYWVRGLPAPHPRPDDTRFSPEGVLSYLEQSGWSLQYSDYRAVGPWNLPGKIMAEREDLRLTLLVGEWSLPTERE